MSDYLFNSFTLTTLITLLVGVLGYVFGRRASSAHTHHAKHASLNAQSQAQADTHKQDQDDKQENDQTPDAEDGHDEDEDEEDSSGKVSTDSGDESSADVAESADDLDDDDDEHHDAVHDDEDDAILRAVDEDEDMESVLNHLKQCVSSSSCSSDVSATASSSPPVPLPAERRIFIVCKNLPVQIHHVQQHEVHKAQQQHAARSARPSISSSHPQPGMPTSTITTLSNTTTTPASSDTSSPASSSASSDTSSSSSSSSSSSWSVEWDDSRSWLSNLRVLLSTPSSSPTSSPHPSFQPVAASASASAAAAEVSWVGITRQHFDSQQQQQDYQQVLAQQHCIPIYLKSSPTLYDEYINGFCKQVLWPLLHYMMPPISNESVAVDMDTMWRAYIDANQEYADVLLAEMKSPTDIIWIHNFHLFCLPGMIRAKQPRAIIGLFIHTPFPSSDVFRSLPTRRELLEAIMCSDVIGFQTFDYARHFLSCIKRVLDLDFETLPGGTLGISFNGRFVSILISHVGISANVFKEAAESEAVIEGVKSLRAQYAGKRIIVGVDDLDVAKGPLLKFQAFSHFLSKYPDYANKIVVLDMLVPSRNTDSESSLLLKRDIMHVVDEIRRKHGDVVQLLEPDGAYSKQATNHHAVLNHAPINLLELVKLYQAADVCLVSSFWEGLALAPFEFTASQDSNSPGVLVISEFMGCSRALNGVLRINPWSLDSTADNLYAALQMPLDERRANFTRRYNYVLTHTLERWARGFIEQVERAVKLGAELNYVTVGSGKQSKLLGLKTHFTHLNQAVLESTYESASLRVFFIDYDGTLVRANDVASSTGLIPPPLAVIKLLKYLSEDPRNVVFLMSGRTRRVLSEWFGHLPQLGLAAEKGVHVRWPQRYSDMCRFDHHNDEQIDESQQQSKNDTNETDDASSTTTSVHESEWESMVELEDVSWKSVAYDIIRSYTEQTDGSWIEDKEFAIVWHYEQADPEYGRMQSIDLQKYLVKALANPKVDVLRYDVTRILEVAPHNVNKGTTATAILESLWLIDSFKHKNAKPPSKDTDFFHPFVLCIGDDRSDEEMFLAVQHKHWLDKNVRGRSSTSKLHGKVATSLQQSTRMLSVASNVSTQSTRSANSLHDTEATHKTANYNPKHENSTDPFLFTVCVGLHPTNAHYYLSEPQEVLLALYGLAKISHDAITSNSIRASSQQTTGLIKRTKHSHTASTSSSTGGGMGAKKGSFAALSSLIVNSNKES